MGKRGPRAKGNYSSKGATLSARITAETRARLEAAAKDVGGSLSQEVEWRFATSQAFGDTNYGLAILIAMVINEVEKYTGQSWAQDLYTFRFMEEAVRWTIKHFKPAGDDVRNKKSPPFHRDDDFRAAALEVPDTIRNLKILPLETPPAVRALMKQQLSKSRPEIMAYGFEAFVIQRLRDAADEWRRAAKVRRSPIFPPDQIPLRDAARFLEPLLVDHLQDFWGNPKKGTVRGRSKK